MTHLSSSQLANALNLSKGRISQYVSQGKLDGCFEGAGRGRRFDLAAVQQKLGLALDAGQMVGNGATTKAALKGLDVGNEPNKVNRSNSEADDAYLNARTVKAQEEARRLRRQNAESDGSYLLASEVALEVRRQIGQEVAEFEGVIKDGARAVADKLGVDFKTARAILIETWRTHRSVREAKKALQAETATKSEAETLGDI
jgi:hypothetical protein